VEAPMIVLDATKLTEPTNADEALAMLVSYAEPGDVVTLHSDWCRTHLDAAYECTCKPIALLIGAKA
jgi:hypothetical protein